MLRNAEYVNNFEIKNVGRGSGFSSAEVAIAEVILPDNGRIFLSRYQDERKWIVDALFSSDETPLYLRKEGERGQELRILEDENIRRELDEFLMRATKLARIAFL